MLNDEAPAYDLNTLRFAGLNLVKAASVRSRVSRTGSYFGVRPMKLANGRVAWPAVQVGKAAEVAS